MDQLDLAPQTGPSALEVARLIKEGMAQQQAVFNTMMQQQMTGMLANLTPALQSLTSRIDAMQAGPKQAEEAAPQEQAAPAAQQELAAQEAQRREQERINNVLQPRDIAPKMGARPRGGAQRKEHRQAIIDRLSSNELEEGERDQLFTLLDLGAQVVPPRIPDLCMSAPSAPRERGWGEGGLEQADRASPALFNFLQDNLLAPASQGEGAARGIIQVFKTMAAKQAKEMGTVTSYKEFAERFRKSKCLSRVALEKDPDAYWQMQWLFHTVHHLFTVDGWGVAGVYYHLVVQRWDEGFLDVQHHVDSEEFRRGDYAGALDMRAWVEAKQPGSAGKHGVSSGTKTRQNKTDTWCNKCKRYFTVEKKHETTTCRQ
jgi:hypothetical protein